LLIQKLAFLDSRYQPSAFGFQQRTPKIRPCLIAESSIQELIVSGWTLPKTAMRSRVANQKDIITITAKTVHRADKLRQAMRKMSIVFTGFSSGRFQQNTYSLLQCNILMH
jgi:hypothetical protein